MCDTSDWSDTLMEKNGLCFARGHLKSRPSSSSDAGVMESKTMSPLCRLHIVCVHSFRFTLEATGKGSLDKRQRDIPVWDRSTSTAATTPDDELSVEMLWILFN